jgi:hypothetical protein
VRIPLRQLAVSVVVTASLVGCGSSKAAPDKTTASPAPTSTVASATGELISTDEYEYRAPKDWEKPPAGNPLTKTDSGALSLHGDHAGDNVSVIRAGSAPRTKLDDLETSLKDGLPDQVKSQGGAAEIVDNKVQIRPRAEVGTQTAVHVAYTFKGATTVMTEQYYVTHLDLLYIVTFSFVPDRTQGERDEISESVLNSWNWAR